MSTSSAVGVVVKEEVPEAPEEENVQNVEFDCLNEDEIKVEDGLPEGRRRRSRRLQTLEKKDPECTTKFLKCVREELEEDRRLKGKRKYERKKQRLAGMTEEDRAIAKERARIMAQARKRKLEENGNVPKAKRKPRKKRSLQIGGGTVLSDEEKRKREEQRMKAKFYHIVRRAEMTEEELEQDRIKRYMKREAWKASKTKEELEELKTKRTESIRRRLQEDENYRRHCVERNKKWKQNLSEEKRERYMDSVKKAVSKYLKNLKVKNPEKYKQNYDKFKERLRRKTANETPEQRQKRLLRYKISAAKQKLKKQLEGEGVTSEIIQTRLDELEKEIRSQPLPPPSEYKPRPRKGQISPKKTENVPQISVPASPIGDDQRPCDSGSVEGTTDSYNYHFISCVPSSEGKTEEICNATLQPAIINIPVLSSLVSLGDASHVVLEDSLSTVTPQFIPATLYTCESGEDYHEHNDFVIVENHFSPPSSPIVPNDPENKPLESVVPEQTQQPVPIPTPPKDFKCPQCPQVYLSDTDLRSHLGTCHTFTCWKCPKCYQVMLSPTELSQHFQTHLVPSTSEQKCSNDTQQKFRDPRGANQIAKFICMRCPFQSSLSSSKMPNNMFETLELLTAHVKRKHPKSFWPCPYCKILKYSKDRLQFHQKCCIMRSSSLSSKFQKTRRKGDGNYKITSSRNN